MENVTKFPWNSPILNNYSDQGENLDPVFMTAKIFPKEGRIQQIRWGIKAKSLS